MFRKMRHLLWGPVRQHETTYSQGVYWGTCIINVTFTWMGGSFERHFSIIPDFFYIFQTAGCFKSKGERCRGGQVSSTADIDSTPSPDAGGVVGCQHQLSGSISQAVVIHKTATPDRGQKHFRQAAAVTSEKQPNSHETYVLQV